MGTLHTLSTGGFMLLAAIALTFAWTVPDNTPRRWKLRLIITFMASVLLVATWWENERRIEAFDNFHARRHLEGTISEDKRRMEALRIHFKRFKERLAELPESQRADVEARIPEKLQELLQSPK